MKKLLSLLLTGMMLMGMTSCLDNNTNNETSFSLSMYNRTVTVGAGDESEFFVNNTLFKINYEKSTITANVTATIGTDNTIQFNVEDMALSLDQNKQAYSFSSPRVATTQGAEITNFRGVVDLQVGVMYLTYNVGSDKTVHATASLPFLFNRTNIIPTDEQKASFTNEKCQYDFSINKSNMTAKVTINYFLKNDTETESAENVAVFDGLKVEFTRDGYKIKADMVKSTTSGKGSVTDAVLKDVEFNIIDQGTRFNGKYTTDTYKAEVAGNMFNEKS